MDSPTLMGFFISLKACDPKVPPSHEQRVLSRPCGLRRGRVGPHALGHGYLQTWRKKIEIHVMWRLHHFIFNLYMCMYILVYIYITCIYFYLDLYDWLCFMIFFGDPFGHLWRVVQIRNTFQCPVLRLSRHGRRVARLEPENCIWCLISDSFCSSSTINDMIWYDMIFYHDITFTSWYVCCFHAPFWWWMKLVEAEGAPKAESWTLWPPMGERGDQKIQDFSSKNDKNG
jgi:hypothetical protein